MNDYMFNKRQKDALQETGNIAAAYAATSLSNLLNERVMIEVTTCRVIEMVKIPGAFGDVTIPTVAVTMDVEDMKYGTIMMLLSNDSAMELCDMFKKRDSGTTEDLGEKEMMILEEVGNICICAYLNVLSQFMDVRMMPFPPKVAFDMIGAILETIAVDVDNLGEEAILVETDFIHRYGRTKGHFLFIPDNRSRQAIFDAFAV